MDKVKVKNNSDAAKAIRIPGGHACLKAGEEREISSAYVYGDGGGYIQRLKEAGFDIPDAPEVDTEADLAAAEAEAKAKAEAEEFAALVAEEEAAQAKAKAKTTTKKKAT